MQIEAHFDESGTSAKEITVAGYLFDASKISVFCDEWSSILAEYDLPYFHMVDCAHHRPPFDKLLKKDTIQVQMRLMRLIKRYSINGIVINIVNDKKKSSLYYRDAVRLAVESVVEWAEATSFSGQIAYFFEAGSNGQGLVNEHFQKIAENPEEVERCFYAGHAFLLKNGNPGVQAADLLAWQYQNFTKKRSENSIARLDLRALLRHPHLINDHCGTPAKLTKIQSLRQSQASIETIYYLPSVPILTLSDGKSANFWQGGDFTLFQGDKSKNVLACPNCFRAVVNGFSIAEFHKFIETKDGLNIVCWCKTACHIPKVMIPMLPEA